MLAKRSFFVKQLHPSAPCGQLREQRRDKVKNIAVTAVVGILYTGYSQGMVNNYANTFSEKGIDASREGG